MRLYTLFDDADYSQNWIQVSLLAYLPLVPIDMMLDVDGLRDEFETVITMITATIDTRVYVFDVLWDLWVWYGLIASFYVTP